MLYIDIRTSVMTTASEFEDSESLHVVTGSSRQDVWFTIVASWVVEMFLW